MLVLTLKRWDLLGDAAALLHPVFANPTLMCAGLLYDLYSTVVHLGPSPNSGHYIAVVRHDTDAGVWWIYDDTKRAARAASWHEVTTFCEYGGQNMQAYILFYSRRE